jgi:hypothetical protein
MNGILLLWPQVILILSLKLQERLVLPFLVREILPND